MTVTTPQATRGIGAFTRTGPGGAVHCACGPRRGRRYFELAPLTGVRVPLNGLWGFCWVDIRQVKSWFKNRDLEVWGSDNWLQGPLKGR